MFFVHFLGISVYFFIFNEHEWRLVSTDCFFLSSFKKNAKNAESRGLIVEIQTHNRKVVSSSLGPAGIVGGGSECTALSPPSIPWRGALEQVTEPPTAPGVCSLLCVCTWMGKCRARIPSMGYHTWLYVTTHSFLKKKKKSNFLKSN